MAGAWAATRYLRGLLFGIEPHDPLIMAGAVALLAAVAVGAAWIPARRAARLDSAAVLQHE